MPSPTVGGSDEEDREPVRPDLLRAMDEVIRAANFKVLGTTDLSRIVSAGLPTNIAGLSAKVLAQPGLFGPSLSSSVMAQVLSLNTGWGSMMASDIWRDLARVNPTVTLTQAVMPAGWLSALMPTVTDTAQTVAMNALLGADVKRSSWRPIVDLLGQLNPPRPWLSPALFDAPWTVDLVRAFSPPTLDVLSAADWLLAFYPRNLRGVDNLELDTVRAVVLEDGIPLSGVPRQQTAQALLGAPDYPARRRILGRRWQSITTDCERLLDRCGSKASTERVRFAQLAIRALREGHVEAAQALAVNLIETMILPRFPGGHQLRPTKRNPVPTGYEDLALRELWPLAPMRSIYQQFWPQDGDPVPTRLSRHATAHTVSRRQFTRANAVTAIMFCTSLIDHYNLS